MSRWYTNPDSRLTLYRVWIEQQNVSWCEQCGFSSQRGSESSRTANYLLFYLFPAPGIGIISISCSVILWKKYGNAQGLRVPNSFQSIKNVVAHKLHRRNVSAALHFLWKPILCFETMLKRPVYPNCAKKEIFIPTRTSSGRGLNMVNIFIMLRIGVFCHKCH